MRISSSLILLSLLSINSACGKWAKASHEEVRTMARPSYPNVSSDVFSLNSSKTATNYRGTLFVANDNASVRDFADLINVSVASRQAWADLRTFEVESDYEKVYKEDSSTAPQQLVLMEEGLQAFELDALSKNPLGYEAKLENAGNFIDREIASLGLTVDQKAAFDAAWGEYCEAKVVELAAHPVLAQNLFKSIPSPAPLCKNYYLAHSMLTSPDCASQTGDYFKCIWLDGVAKTRWFTSPKEAVDATLATARTEKRQKLTELFSEANYEATRGIFGFVESAFVFTTPIYKKLYFEKKEAFLNIVLDQKSDATCVKVVANAGSQDLCRIFGISPEGHTPRQIIKAVENVSPDAKIFTPLPKPADRSVSTQDLIRYLNERNRFETSEGDRLFMELKSGSSLEQPSFTGAGTDFTDRLSLFRSTLAADFYGAFSANDLEQRSVKKTAIDYQAKLIAAHRAESQRLTDVMVASTDLGVTIANRPGFGHGFLQYDMIYEQFGNVLSAQFSFNGHSDYAFRACYDLEKNQALACPVDLPLKSGTTFLDAKLTRATDGGMIEFSFTISPAEEIGLGPKARADAKLKPDFFMDLPVTELEGRTLRFELYRNRLGGYMDIMTGKAFIEEAGQRKYEAGVSMWEQAL